MSDFQLVDQPNICVHCSRKFRNPSSLFSHMCEQKRRAMQRTEKRVQAGYMIYNRFYQLTQNQQLQKSYEHFCKSLYYNAFVKFGSFINNTNPLYPDKFIDYVIKSGVKLDQWCRDALYEKYLYDMLKVEPVDSAIERSITTMIEWGDKNSTTYSNYFKDINLNRAVHDIKNGRVSCWVLLNCKSGKELLANLSDEQLDMLSPVLDMTFWLRKFKDRTDDAQLAKEVCKETGI